MLINVIVDNLLHQLYIDEVCILLNIIVDDLCNDVDVEDFELVDFDIVADDFEEHLVVHEHLLVLLDEVDKDIGDDVHIDILRGILKIVLVEKLNQKIVVEDGCVVLVKIV